MKIFKNLGAFGSRNMHRLWKGLKKTFSGGAQAVKKRASPKVSAGVIIPVTIVVLFIYDWIAGLFALIFLICLYVIYRQVDWAAQNDTDHSIFTMVLPREAKIVVRGKTAEKVLIGDLDRALDEDGNVILQKRTRDLWDKMFGWRYVGFLRGLHALKMTLSDFKDESDPSKGLQVREFKTNRIFLKKSTFAATLRDTEAIHAHKHESDEDDVVERIAVDATILWTTHILNPEIATFDVKSWNERLAGMILSALQQYVAKNTYDDLHTQGGMVGEEGFWKYLQEIYPPDPNMPEERKALMEKLGGNTGYIYFEKLGVLVDVVELVSVELSGTASEELKKALNAAYVAHQEGKAMVEKGRAQKQVLKDLAEGRSALADVFIKTAGAPGIVAGAQAVADLWKNDGVRS